MSKGQPRRVRGGDEEVDRYSGNSILGYSWRNTNMDHSYLVFLLIKRVLSPIFKLQYPTKKYFHVIPSNLAES